MQWLGPKDIATLLGIHEKTAVRMFRSGEIPCFRAGPKLWRISLEGFEAWAKAKVEAHRVLTAPALPLRVVMRDRDRQKGSAVKVNGNAGPIPKSL